MKIFSYVLLFLTSATLLPMDLPSNNHLIKVQIGDGKPFNISSHMFTKCAFGTVGLGLKQNINKINISKTILLDGQPLQTEDVLMVLKLVEAPHVINTISKNHIEHIFFTANFMCVAKDILTQIARRYIALLGNKFEKLDPLKKETVLYFLKSIKNISANKKYGTYDAGSIISLGIDLSSSGLDLLHDILLIRSHLMHFGLNGNNITDLDFGHNNLVYAYLKEIGNLCPNLETLNLEHNNITNITQEGINALPDQLMVLNLKYNKISKFVSQLKFKNIIINLKGNHLSPEEQRRIEQLADKPNSGIITTTIFLSIMLCHMLQDVSIPKSLLSLSVLLGGYYWLLCVYNNITKNNKKAIIMTDAQFQPLLND